MPTPGASDKARAASLSSAPIMLRVRDMRSRGPSGGRAHVPFSVTGKIGAIPSWDAS